MDDYYDDYLSDDDVDHYSRKSVPIWLALSLVVAYIVWGSFIFRVSSTISLPGNCGVLFWRCRSACTTWR